MEPILNHGRSPRGTTGKVGRTHLQKAPARSSGAHAAIVPGVLGAHVCAARDGPRLRAPGSTAGTSRVERGNVSVSRRKPRGATRSGVAKAIPLEAGKALEQLLHGNCRLQARKGGSEAQVNAVPEAEVAIRRAANMETLGLRELPRVEIGRRKKRQ